MGRKADLFRGKVPLLHGYKKGKEKKKSTPHAKIFHANEFPAPFSFQLLLLGLVLCANTGAMQSVRATPAPAEELGRKTNSLNVHRSFEFSVNLLSREA